MITPNNGLDLRTGIVEITDANATGAYPTVPAQVTVANTYDLGSIVVTKVRVGAGAEKYGIGPFGVDVACTFRGVDLPIIARLQLSAASGYTQTVTDLPIGSACTVREVATAGADSSVIVPNDGVALTVGRVTVPAGEPAAVEVTNHFGLGSLQVVKKRVGPGAGSADAVGPFSVMLTCTPPPITVVTPDGRVQALTFTPTPATVKLGEANGYAFTLAGLPVGTTCTVREIDKGKAVSSVVSPGSVTIGDGVTVTVTVTNTFKTPPTSPPAGTSSSSPPPLGPPTFVTGTPDTPTTSVFGTSTGSTPATTGTGSTSVIVVVVPPTPPVAPPLAYTGVPLAGELLWALALLLAGAGLLLGARRRQRAGSHR